MQQFYLKIRSNIYLYQYLSSIFNNPSSFSCGNMKLNLNDQHPGTQQYAINALSLTALFWNQNGGWPNTVYLHNAQLMTSEVCASASWRSVNISKRRIYLFVWLVIFTL